MQVLLREDVKGLGRRGDIVTVAKGYARNHLIPSGSGIAATDGTARQAESMKRSRDLREAQDRETAQAQAALLTGKTISISARAHEGKLFGSVAQLEIAEAITAQTGVEVDRHHVVLAEHLRDIGKHEVSVTLFTEVTAVVTVEITEEA
ncbi:MAG: 50S ribosomal protein L9 [Actinomycetota bacterium]